MVGENSLRILYSYCLPVFLGFPDGSAGKESTCNAGDPGSILELGRSSGEGTGYPLQYSGLENSMDRGARQTTVHGFTKSWTRLTDFQFTSLHIQKLFSRQKYSHLVVATCIISIIPI